MKIAEAALVADLTGAEVVGRRIGRWCVRLLLLVTVWLLVGLTGSGKRTFAHRLEAVGSSG